MSTFKYVFILLFFILINNAKANYYNYTEKNTVHAITIGSHSLIASKGSRYQWYLNNIKIDDAISQELQVSSPGIYKLEMTDLNGEIIEKQTIIGLTNTGAIIRVFTIGDSTVQDYTAGYYPRKGWGQVLPIFFNAASVTIINKAVGGTSSKSFYNLYWKAIRDGLQAGDFVFIQFGINDATNTDTSRYAPTGGVFEGYLTKFVNETRAKGAFPVLVATLRRNAWNADGVTVYDAYHNYPIATRTVAKSLIVPLIDLDARAKVLLESVGELYATRLLYNNYLPKEYPNYPTGNADNVHFQEMGAIEMAKLVTQGIRALSTDPNVSKLIPFLKPEYQIAISVNPSGADSVTTHTTTYPQGLTITLKTIPKVKSTFQKWNTANSTQLSTATLTTVTSGNAATSYAAIYAGSTACTASITSSTATFCAGGSIVLTASTGSAYKWFNGSTQVGTAITYNATTAGSYTVEVTNSAGCKAASTAKVITINPLPIITQLSKIDTGPWITSSTASACEASSVNLGPQPNAAAGWVWTGPNNFTSTLRNPVLTNVLIANTGNYIATYTDPNGCSASSIFSLQVTKPTATITAPTTSFCSGSSVLLTASIGSSYKWFNGTTQVGTNATYTAITAGTYTVEVTNVSGCKATSAVTQISVSSLPTASITTPNTSFCIGSSALLTASSGSSYKWFNGTTQVGTAATYTATNSGSYTVEVINVSGCKATSAATQISESAAPTAAITAPATSFCTGSSVTLTANTGASYKWFNGSTQVGTAATYTPTVAGAYTVEVTNTSGCKATSAITQITVSALPIASITAPATSFCAGGSVVLTSSTGASYKWFNGTTQVSTAGTYTANTAGAYTVEVTNTSGCKATSAITLTVSGLPIASITTPATSFCAGGSVVLTSSTGASYKWFNGTTQVGMNATYTTTTAGAYTVEVTNASGCKATSAVITVTVSDSPIANITATNTSFCKGNSVVLTASAGSSYKWYNSGTIVGTNQIHSASTPGNYVVEVTNANGCKSTSAATQITVTNSITWYADTDNDGKGDPSATLAACTQPSGYVSIAGDACPTDPNKIDPGNCGCGKTETSCLDCAGIPNGTALFDNCHICVGGTTGNTACLSTATVNGTTANIKVTPQPFDANTSITIDNLGMIQSFTIIGASGTLVETKQGLNTEEITLGDNLASGMYNVIITTENGIYTTKVIKK
jgi:lysophospholipase L1-like esterase